LFVVRFFKDSVPEVGSVSVIGHKGGKIPVHLDPLETASFDHWMLKEILSRTYILLMSTLTEYMLCLKLLSVPNDQNWLLLMGPAKWEPCLPCV
jgi:hypothetical protein